MKKLMLLGIVFVSFTLSSCETFNTLRKVTTADVNFSVTNNQGVVHDDQIVVRTEQSLKIALSTFDLFIDLERTHEKALKDVSPQIHIYANKVRLNGKKWIKSAQVAKNAYKKNRTEKNHANLVTAWKMLQAGIDESKKYISTVK